jgi:DNA-binding response OmpR family regulator
VLVIEDDPHFAFALRTALEAVGYVVTWADDGAIGMAQAATTTFDLVVLDIMLPSLNGFRICAELRARSVWTPILMLTAKSGEWDQAESLDAGADDYLVKPVSIVVLLAHVRALLRRAQLFTSRTLVRNGIALDPVRQCCTVEGTTVDLSAKEVEVLAFLMNQTGTVPKRELVSAIWGDDFAGDANIVEVYVSHLRKKLEDPTGRRMIETVRGVGYRLVWTAEDWP